MSDYNIVVLGAGIIGLTTALELQKQFRNAQVTVLAENFEENTTTAVAAGIFRPSTNFTGPSEDVTKQWINDSYNYWDALRLTRDAADAGVAQLSGYLFSSISCSIVRNHYLETLVPLYRRATEEERDLCPGDWKYGSFFTTLLIESGLFLPWATNRFLNAGGRIIQKKVQAFTELAGKYDVTVNCTGLGAKYLCGDSKLVPIRGQVLKVHAPWLKTFFYGDYDTYVIPGFKAVTLGGCRQYESYNLNVCKYDTLAIRERCESMLPSLRTATVLATKVGLRPHRDPVRVEKETVTVYENRIRVVHNYGHGGYGVTTAPGTAMHAVQLAKEIMTGNSKL